VIQSLQCACGHTNEDPDHFFLACPLYDVQRIELFHEAIHISNNICVNTFLHGDLNISNYENELLFDAVHRYIISTERFE
jgi:hypothetical protein